MTVEHHAGQEVRCTQRKHVIENGQPACDCEALILYPTAAQNALVVTLPPSMFVRPDPTPRLPEIEIGDGFGV